MLLDDRFRPITDTAGLFERGVTSCASEYVGWMQPIVSSGGSRLRIAALPTAPLEHQLRSLEPLVRGGITRMLFVDTTSGWTACFTNGWRGTDMGSIVPMLATRLGCDALRVTCTPDLGKGQHRRFGARIVEAHHGQQAPIRVIGVANDGGKWVEYRGGAPLPAEDPTWFSASRVRERFTRPQLQGLVNSLVPGFWDINLWSGEAVVVERVGNLPATFTDISLIDVQKNLPTEA